MRARAWHASPPGSRRRPTRPAARAYRRFSPASRRRTCARSPGRRSPSCSTVAAVPSHDTSRADRASARTGTRSSARNQAEIEIVGLEEPLDQIFLVGDRAGSSSHARFGEWLFELDDRPDPVCRLGRTVIDHLDRARSRASVRARSPKPQDRSVRTDEILHATAPQPALERRRVQASRERLVASPRTRRN